ncbi:organic cation transporter protein-like [Saccostrea echinata]|uniref:organic cation transporter protein-like n=1 Tax=Saccostrea echinata TaxID=191078 RepID=UPI002A804857|nr:organic cation transporter protein-like [Saccostrea echinata]
MDYDDVIADLDSFVLQANQEFYSVHLSSLRCRCKIPFFDNDTYDVQSDFHLAAINKTIPLNPDGTYSSCTVLINGTERKCSEWVYDRSRFIRTVTSDFNLVCDSLYVRSHLKIAYLVGFLVASMFSQIGDVYGRRIVMLILCTLRVAVVFAVPFSINPAMFGILRFFEGLTSLAFYQMSFVTAIELVGPSERLFTANFSKMLYCMGEFLLILLAFFERDWVYLTLWLAIPTVPPLIYWLPGLIPESPRWLTSRGKTEEATKILRKIAKVNKIKKKFDASKIKREEDQGVKVILKELVHSRILMKRLFIVIANWFVAAFIYYGLTMNVGSLGGNLYENFSLLVFVELIGYCVIFFMNKTGRKPLHLLAIFGCGVASVGSILLILFAENTLYWLHIALSLISRFGISVLFAVLYVYTGELFPTVIRSIVMGTVSIGARVGALISPYLYDVTDGKIGKMLPLITYSVITIIVGLLSIQLPETNKRKLIETVEEVEVNMIKGKGKFTEEEPQDTVPLNWNPSP